MELNTSKTSESEEGYGEEEESEEECVKGEAAIPSNAFQQALSKTDYNTFRNGVPLYTVPKKIPKKIVTPAEPDLLEVGRRREGRNTGKLSPGPPHLPSSRVTLCPSAVGWGIQSFPFSLGKRTGNTRDH